MNYNPILSRTNWIQVLIIAIAVINAVVPFLSPDYQAIATTVLGILAMVTHTSTAVKSNASN